MNAPDHSTFTALRIAEQIGVTRETVLNWARRGLLPGGTCSSGRQKWLFQASDLVKAAQLARNIPEGLRRHKAPNPSAFHSALRLARERTGLTIAALCAASKVSEATLHRWTTGKSKPLREGLERLVEVLNAPELLSLIEISARHPVRSPHQQIRMTCRECGKVRDETPGQVREFERKRDPDRLSVDWEAGEATHFCDECTGRARFTKRNLALIKDHGRSHLRKERSKAAKAQIAANPEGHAVKLRAAQAASAALGLQHLDKRAMARYRLSRLKLKLRGEIKPCSLCGLILFIHEANAHSQRVRGGRTIGAAHGPCFRKWRTTKDGRRWLSDCFAARRSGEPTPPIPSKLRGRGRPVTSASLSGAYEATVRYFRQRERTKHALRNEDGEPLNVTQLAIELGFKRGSLLERVQWFLNHLPEETVATGPVRTWREIFLTLRPDPAVPKRAQQPPELT